jgi:hypothetical protein
MSNCNRFSRICFSITGTNKPIHKDKYPLRSSYLTTTDLYLLGGLKDSVYKINQTTLKKLKQNIRLFISSFTNANCQLVTSNTNEGGTAHTEGLIGICNTHYNIIIFYINVNFLLNRIS